MSENNKPFVDVGNVSKEYLEYLKTTKITDETESYSVSKYPLIKKLMDEQLDKNFWTATEILVENDKLELLYKLDEDQQNAIKKILPMFLRYELEVADYWGEIYPKLFKAPECQALAAAIKMIELCVHAPFYNKINIEYGMDTDEDYLSFLTDPDFVDRAKWIRDILSDPDPKKITLAFGMIEASALFSNFVLLRSFQYKGINLIPAIVRGTVQSARDERLHSLAITTTMRYYYAEKGMTINDDKEYLDMLFEQANIMFENEKHIIKSIVPDTEYGLNGITRSEYEKFVKRRIDEYFERLGCDRTPFGIKYSELDELFEIQQESYKESDFFNKGVNSEYETIWIKNDLIKAWK